MNRTDDSHTFDGVIDLLAFGAHPDDAEICCGGLLASAAKRGHRTAIVDLSRGELGSLGTPELRAAEAERAARILDVAHRENLGLPDGWIFPYSGYDADAAERPAISQLTKVVGVLRRLRPTVVLIPWAHERHPDHEAASALLDKALFFAGVRKFPAGNGKPDLPPFSPAEVLYYPMRYDPEPSFITDISDVVEQKGEAIRAYASQLTRSAPVLEDPSHPSPLIASSLTLEAFEARDRAYGARIGTRAGEPYVCRGTLNLPDPVSFFRETPTRGALFFGRPR